MRVGVFTPLLAQLPLKTVLQKLKALNITTVELGTGNFPGDPHCKLSMLENGAELREFQAMLADHSFPSVRSVAMATRFIPIGNAPSRLAMSAEKPSGSPKN